MSIFLCCPFCLCGPFTLYFLFLCLSLLHVFVRHLFNVNPVCLSVSVSLSLFCLFAFPWFMTLLLSISFLSLCMCVCIYIFLLFLILFFIIFHYFFTDEYVISGFKWSHYFSQNFLVINMFLIEVSTKVFFISSILKTSLWKKYWHQIHKLIIKSATSLPTTIVVEGAYHINIGSGGKKLKKIIFCI